MQKVVAGKNCRFGNTHFAQITTAIGAAATRRNLSTFVMTETDDRLIAAAAIRFDGWGPRRKTIYQTVGPTIFAKF